MLNCDVKSALSAPLLVSYVVGRTTVYAIPERRTQFSPRDFQTRLSSSISRETSARAARAAPSAAQAAAQAAARAVRAAQAAARAAARAARAAARAESSPVIEHLIVQHAHPRAITPDIVARHEEHLLALNNAAGGRLHQLIHDPKLEQSRWQRQQGSSRGRVVGGRQQQGVSSRAAGRTSASAGQLQGEAGELGRAGQRPTGDVSPHADNE